MPEPWRTLNRGSVKTISIFVLTSHPHCWRWFSILGTDIELRQLYIRIALIEIVFLVSATWSSTSHKTVFMRTCSILNSGAAEVEPSPINLPYVQNFLKAYTWAHFGHPIHFLLSSISELTSLLRRLLSTDVSTGIYSGTFTPPTKFPLASMIVANLLGTVWSCN